MRSNRRGWRVRARLALLGTGAMFFQFPGCGDIGDITATTTTTFNGREALIQILRGIILTPIDNLITQAVTNLVGVDEQ